MDCKKAAQIASDFSGQIVCCKGSWGIVIMNKLNLAIDSQDILCIFSLLISWDILFSYLLIVIFWQLLVYPHLQEDKILVGSLLQYSHIWSSTTVSLMYRDYPKPKKFLFFRHNIISQIFWSWVWLCSTQRKSFATCRWLFKIEAFFLKHFRKISNVFLLSRRTSSPCLISYRTKNSHFWIF